MKDTQIFWALAGSGYQTVYYGIFVFFLGVPVYIWMKYQRREYGESPVSPVDYPIGSPYANGDNPRTGPPANGSTNGHRGRPARSSAVPQEVPLP